MKRLMPAIVLFGLCSCSHKGDNTSQSVSQQFSPPKIDRVTKPRSRDEVMRERRVMGRWRSHSGVLPGSKNQWLILDIAGTKDARMEIRSTDVRREAVTAFATGHIAMSPTGIVFSLPDARGALADFRSGSATFPTTSTMTLKTGNKRQFEFVYDGQ